MTKRVLSLLLTLVMVLSLCVPAIAADGEFVAEAPADVVEEAPAAPVEPEAPEAEEPAEEPVVDEPVAEEADAPEMAAMMEEEDLPYLVALGVIDKVNHYKLEKALEVADVMKEKVDAEEVYGYNEWQNIQNTKSRTASFDAAYTEAKRCMDAINGLPITGDVSNDGVKNAAARLLNLILKDDGGTQTNKTATGVLVSDVDTVKAAGGKIVESDVKTYLTNTLISGATSKSAYAHDAGIDPSFTANETTFAKMAEYVDTHWGSFYQENYVDAVKAALDTFAALDENSTYADYAAAVKQLRAAAELEPVASAPTKADATALSDEIKATEAAYKDWNEEKDATVKAAKAAKWVDGSAVPSSLTTAHNAVANAKRLLDETTATGFADTSSDATTYSEFINAWGSVSLTENTVTVAVAKQKLTINTVAVSSNVVEKKVKSVQIVMSKDTALDSKDYGYAYSVNGVYADLDNNPGDASRDPVKADLLDSTFAPNNKYGKLDYNDATIKIVPLKGLDGSAAPDYFEPGDIIVLYIYEKLSSTDYSTNPVIAAYTVNLYGEDYDGPVINKDPAEVKYVSGDTSADPKYTALNSIPSGASAGSAVMITVKPNDKFATTDFVEAAGTSDDLYTITASVQDASDKDIALAGKKTVNTGSVETLTITVGDDVDDKLTVGKMDVVLSVKTSSGEGPVPHSTAQVTVEPLTKYTKGMTALKSMIKDADKLSKADYTLQDTSGYGLYGTYDAAWTALQGFISDAKAINSNATTLANTYTNRDDLNTAIANVCKTFTYLKKVTANKEAFNEALLKAKQTEDEDYSYQTWGALQVAIEKFTAATWNTDQLQSEYDKAVEELNAAMAALTEEEGVDKATLQSAITAAEALKEADYTPESWKAADLATAIANAKSVLANENATQAMVNAAIEGIRVARNKLVSVVTDEDIKKPASGTGWGYNTKTGEDVYYLNGVMLKDFWLPGNASRYSFWYYIKPDGTLARGFQYVTNPNGTGWYMLQADNTNGMRGVMLTGGQQTYTFSGGVVGAPAAGWGWFQTARGVDYGKCTYTSAWGDYNATTGIWGDGIAH